MAQVCSAMGWEYTMPVCALFMSSGSSIVFNPIAGSITDHSQSAKDLYLKFQLYVEDPGHRKPVLISPNWLSKPGERSNNRNFNFCRGWDSTVRRVTTELSPLSDRYYSTVDVRDAVDLIL